MHAKAYSDNPKVRFDRFSFILMKSTRGPHSLIISGKNLNLVFERHSRLFYELASQCSAVICCRYVSIYPSIFISFFVWPNFSLCRVTPQQKADVVRLVKSTGKLTLAIGDGFVVFSLLDLNPWQVGMMLQ